MRALIVGNWPPPTGGVSVHVEGLTERLRTEGHTVTVLDVGRGRHTGPGLVAAPGVTRFPLQLTALADSHDLIHLHTSGANPKSWALIALVGLVARTMGRTALLTLHSGHAVTYLDTPARALVARAALAPFDRIICVSTPIELMLRRIGAGDRRRVVIPAFGGRPTALPPPPAAVTDLRRRYRRLVCAALAPGTDYGAQPLLEAFARLRPAHPDIALVLFGEGSDRLRGPHVLGLGALRHPEALATMATCDLFVRPTLVDGDSISLREAVALGLPCVATRVGARPEGVVLCEPNSADSLATALESALPRSRGHRTKGRDGIGEVVELMTERVDRARIANALREENGGLRHHLFRQRLVRGPALQDPSDEAGRA
jgi:glycogen(starch) synthase